jgi:phosphoserine phosphatase
MKSIKAVILDLDQTLTVDQGSWLELTRLLGADFNIHLDIYNRYKSGELDYITAKKELISLWRSVSILDRKSIIDIFEKIELRDYAEEAIEYLKTKYNICIISGAIDLFVETIASKLEVEDYYASTKFLFDNDDNLVDFKYTLSRGEEKLEFFNDYLLKTGLNPNQCSAIGDGDSDMPIFEKVAYPILFIATETTEENKNKIKNHLYNWKDIEKYL